MHAHITYQEMAAVVNRADKAQEELAKYKRYYAALYEVSYAAGVRLNPRFHSMGRRCLRELQGAAEEVEESTRSKP